MCRLVQSLLGGLLEDAGLPWALARLRDACKLNLTVASLHEKNKPYLASDVARAVMQASHELTKLDTLVCFPVLGP